MKKTEDLIKEVAREIVMLLIEKNKAYGDTANDPPKIFSKLSAKEGILARIDDKLSRIKTVDEKIVKALRDKINIASEVMGEELKEWI